MATLRLIEQKRTLGFKIEGTPYTAESLAVGDYDYQAYDINYGPEVEMYARKLARGEFARDKSVAGRRKVTMSWKVDIHSGAAAATPPQYFQMLRCCGLKQNTYGATGVALITDSLYNRVPATIEVVEMQEGTTPKQLVIKAHGAMGNARIICDQIGQPVRIEFEFTGVLTSITTRAFASIITPTAFDSGQPSGVLAATINLFATTQFLSKWTIDLGNTVELFTDPSKSQGFEGARVVDRAPTLELDPDMLSTDDIDLYSNQITNTTGALSLNFGENITASAPACQIVDSYKPASREGHVTNSLRLELKRSSGNDEFELLQGSKS